MSRREMSPPGMGSADARSRWSAGQTRLCSACRSLSTAKFFRNRAEIALGARLTDHRGEVPVHRGVLGQLGMKCGHDHRALTGHDALTAMHDERSHLRAHPPDAGSPDEDHLDGPATLAQIRLPFRLEALLLPAVCVPLARDIDEAERRLPRACH